MTGEGLPGVLRGADVLVDVSNSPSFAVDDVMEFFQRSTGNLVRATCEARAGFRVSAGEGGAGEADPGPAIVRVASRTLRRLRGSPLTSYESCPS
ncbi:hypothetical protein [Amycolatopsis rubida]|uniref:hypothetical protein n=1 Tax=Amycolatopsis rubida TaxID=112413 RepID=UPI0018E3EBCE|nr:hypothetical protein [Amycolatopsis rubida]